MLYHLYEFAHAAMSPARTVADQAMLFFRNPFNPLAHTTLGRGTAAAAELIERTTRRYNKPRFDITGTRVGEREVAVSQEVVWERPFCKLLHFRRELPELEAKAASRVLIVAPMSGHYATLLGGTVEGLLPFHEVYITDWTDARMVPMADGAFDLDDYVDYLIEMFHLFKGDVHVLAVCQPSVPVLTAVALMEAQDDPLVPRSMVMMGGPIDTRVSKTAVNELAERKGTDWFRRNVITGVPWPYPGFGRKVYPGFLQLTGFMSMNLDRHVNAHKDLFLHLVKGDGDSAEKHREFYDEYLAVMDLTAEFYLQTIEQVFVRHALPNGTMTHRGVPVDPKAIQRVALMTIEGEKDDITGLGQCQAAHGLCKNLARSMRRHLVQPMVGHYGIFNGSRYRKEIVPQMTAFMRAHDVRAGHFKRLMASLRGGRGIEAAPSPLPKELAPPASRVLNGAAPAEATVTAAPEAGEATPRLAH
jgi:poly(3-hydroxybutyrate) depolymerase